MRGQAKDTRLTVQAATTQLAMMLASAPAERIAALTADSLIRMYRVPKRQIEAMLQAAQATEPHK